MLLGIDIGTQSLKAVVTDEALRPLGEGSRPYAFSCLHPGWAEQDPRLWLAALRPAIADALAAAGRSGGDVRGIGIAGQLDGCLAVDAAGDPLGPCLIWMDRRAEAEMPGIDLPALRRRTGVVPDPIHMGAKIRWLSRRSTPAAAMYHQPVSFVVQRLCGAAVMDAALASTSMLYDLEAGDYAPLVLLPGDPNALADQRAIEQRLRRRPGHTVHPEFQSGGNDVGIVVESFVHSVASAGPAWVERFNRLVGKSPLRVLQMTEEMPRWLGGKRNYGVWQRDNLWMLYNALAHGATEVTVIALWDGGVGDGPGGTADLVDQARKRGAKIVILSAKALFALQ